MTLQQHNDRAAGELFDCYIAKNLQRLCGQLYVGRHLSVVCLPAKIILACRIISVLAVT